MTNSAQHSKDCSLSIYSVAQWSWALLRLSWRYIYMSIPLKQNEPTERKATETNTLSEDANGIQAGLKIERLTPDYGMGECFLIQHIYSIDLF